MRNFIVSLSLFLLAACGGTNGFPVQSDGTNPSPSNTAPDNNPPLSGLHPHWENNGSGGFFPLCTDCPLDFDGGGSNTGDDSGMTDGNSNQDSGAGGSGGSGGIDAALPPDGGNSNDASSDGNSSDGDDECVKTQGYWKNHSSNWPETELLMGNFTYTEAQCLDLLNDSSMGDASVILARQLIAALLNGMLANPGRFGYPTYVETIVMESESWLRNNDTNSLPLPFHTDPNSPEGQEAVRLAGILDRYNSGHLGFPECN